MTSNITEPQEDNTIRKRTTVYTRKKKRIVSLFREDHRIASIFRIKSLGYRSVQTVVRQYITKRRISVSPRSIKTSGTLMIDDIVEFVENEIRLECAVTLKKLQSRIFVQFSVKPSLETIRKSLLNISITFKKLNCVLEAVNFLRSKNLSFEYAIFFE
ncbi:hypothetical protein CDIK_3818 [Cucumispora dikerogammari]|nr:hypothetical protein CDIK_3818 [Cucumispora dikerogammari]